ncbi:MAG: 4Fe-4S ferredoxin [Anaerolineae bacterium]|jgi:CDP-4-dehydro-6-deoxyglucose reductase|nr:4Fe-4S ferredoxin [Anaerolineae bacterium]
MAKPRLIGTDLLGREIYDHAAGDWFGVPRHEVYWGPTVDAAACIGCGMCYVSCSGRVVYDWDVLANRPIVARFDNCSPGCTTCANLCPADAITFPAVATIRAVRDQHQVVAQARRKVAALKSVAEAANDN